ncbi:hypothetical protein EV130_11180 [Rhizobium azibense]|uniref:Uncharacterized protein n=1 Tax=Rhizobium azibense TaxID=1136135 RepID=A0A4R3QHH0_9HYPH|nr:hypothetical protein EV130_11180 [Rhizobium azibense]TCU32281.1 hypothetical protein EV129_12170 [Rhizobium azibense]
METMATCYFVSAGMREIFANGLEHWDLKKEWRRKWL